MVPPCAEKDLELQGQGEQCASKVIQDLTKGASYEPIPMARYVYRACDTVADSSDI